MFKLIPTTQDFFVCLRCQCRLFVRQGPPFGRRHHTEHPQQLRRFTSGSSLGEEQSSSQDIAAGDGDFGRAPIRYCTEDWPGNRNYRYGNEPSTKDSLGLNVLGEPAEVLILRDKQNRFQLDSNMARLRASGPDKNPVQESISSSEMLEKMDAEKGIVDIDDVCINIESVRASWVARTKSNITEIAYKDLYSRLQEGFTKPQLGAYLDRAAKDPAADVFNLNVEMSNSLYARSSWQLVGNMPLPKHKAPQIANKAPEGESNKREVPGIEHGHGISKDTLVQRILSQCWNIVPRFQKSSLGELYIRLQKLHLDLILNHKRDILKLISRSYDAKVEAWPQDRIIRITSDYDNCVDISKLLIHTLENIESSTIDIDVDSMSHPGLTPSPRKLNDVLLRQIEEYTNTLVRRQAFDRTVLRVFYLGPDDTDLLETRRLIHQILGPASVHNPKLAWSKGGRMNNVTPAPVDVGSRLSLVDRNKQWSRWCCTQTENSTSGKKGKDGVPLSSLLPDSATQPMQDTVAFNTVKSFFQAPDDTSYKLCSNDTPYWTSEIEYHDSVKFGQVLFPAKMADPILDTLERKRRAKNTGRNVRPIHTRDIALKSTKQPRAFVPLVHGLVRSLESLGSLEKSEEFWKIRLSPSSKNVSLPVPVIALPDLEIRIFVDRDERTTSVKDVRLVHGKEKDFLQPQNIVDLRFIRRQCVYAKDDSIDPRIASFVQNSNFDIWGTEQIKTPLGLSLSIPALALQPHKGFDPTSHQTLLVDYISFGLEHTSLLTMPYQEPDSWPTLTYTSVEAGRIGGRRDELSLHNLRFASKQLAPADPDSSSVSVDDESLSLDEHTSIFFQKTASLIKSIELAGTGQPVDRGTSPVKGLSMPEVRRWRRIKKKPFRRVEYPKASSRPGYLPPVNETVRRVVAIPSVRAKSL